MPVPNVIVLLETPTTIPGGINISGLLSQETNSQLSMLIEDPTGTNNFTTGDVTLKGYDVPNGVTVRNYFSTMTPTSTNHTILMSLGIIPPGGVVLGYDVLFQGYIAPNTVQFEPRTGAFSFTVIGVARKLQTTSAAGLFQRSGYFDGKWVLYSDVSSLDKTNTTIVVKRADSVAVATCDFAQDDQIQLGKDEIFTVVSVVPDPATSPPTFWSLVVSSAPTKNYGSLLAVHLLTPYQRNLILEDVVDALFTAAGFPNKQYFFSAPLPNLGLSGLFTAPMNPAGLPGGFGVGIAPTAENAGVRIAVSGPSGVYMAASAISGFSLITNGTGFKQPPVDATNYQSPNTMFGPKRSRTRAANPRYGLNLTMKFYGYDHLAGNKRYILTVSINGDVAPGGSPAITTTLSSETCTAWVWGGTAVIGGIGIATTTDTSFDPDALYDACGIDVDPATGTVFFTDIQLTGGAGSSITFNVSSYEPGGVGYVANRAAGVSGPLVITAPGRLVAFMVDGILGIDPQAFLYTLSAPGVMTVQWASAISPYVIARSLKRNAGDGRYYVLISDPNQGILIQSFSSDALIADLGHPPAQIAPAPVGASAQVTPGSTTLPYVVDLAIEYGVSNGLGQPCPMFALIGGSPVYISNAGSGLIPYADMSGLSVADALQQLSTTIAGLFYLNQNGNNWIFRSRSSPMPGNTIGTNDQIDGDQGVISLTVQPVYNLWTGYVSVTNENDETIFGDTSNVAGSIAYANADGLNLQLSTRFVTSSSFARALANSSYNYLGAKKRWIEVNRFRDGRVYEIGRTFHCIADLVNRQFQIIEVGLSVTGATVKVVGLEV